MHITYARRIPLTLSTKKKLRKNKITKLGKFRKRAKPCNLSINLNVVSIFWL